MEMFNEMAEIPGGPAGQGFAVELGRAVLEGLGGAQGFHQGRIRMAIPEPADRFQHRIQHIEIRGDLPKPLRIGQRNPPLVVQDVRMGEFLHLEVLEQIARLPVAVEDSTLPLVKLPQGFLDPVQVGKRFQEFHKASSRVMRRPGFFRFAC